MGYMTTILFLNDAYGVFEKNPEETVANILRAMDDASGREQFYGVSGHANPMKPLRTAHADVPRLMLAHQNMLVEYGYMSELKDRPDLLDLRKRNLKLAKKILKEEEEEIKKAEAALLAKK